ncbi:MAG: tol-pal system protein YbgF [Emcibacteraceae bacterium]|nr:tol-pal system protein YbgF [Emcibacteraceae bacterium]
MLNKALSSLPVLSMVIVIIISITDSATAQSTRQRLTAIEKQLTSIQRQVFTPGSRFQSGSTGSAPGAATGNTTTSSEGALIAEINIRISELETQLRQMTGQLEEATFKISNMTRQLETMQKDNEFRFAELEKNGTTSGGGMTAVTTPTSVAPLPSGTPKQQYDYAYGLVSNAQYEQAEVSFLEFLRAHPKDTLAGNAQYWLGQTYYARGNYADATRSFLEGMSKYPQSPKAPAYLLKVGMSLNLLGEKSEACEIYRELNARFPDSSENTRMRPTEERKAGCS